MPATLSLMGSVRLRGTVGDDLTPRSQKARGALALLGTAPDLRLSRARMQDLLWSERSKQQGSDSLRQLLRHQGAHGSGLAAHHLAQCANLRGVHIQTGRGDRAGLAHRHQANLFASHYRARNNPAQRLRISVI